nr:MAG TPA: hypothetical protein [Microviridae sp.]
MATLLALFLFFHNPTDGVSRYQARQDRRSRRVARRKTIVCAGSILFRGRAFERRSPQ